MTKRVKKKMQNKTARKTAAAPAKQTGRPDWQGIIWTARLFCLACKFSSAAYGLVEAAETHDAKALREQLEDDDVYDTFERKGLTGWYNELMGACRTAS